MGEVRPEIVKPRTDKREYRNVVLRNELRVLLVSDPDTDKAAAAMDVNVGSFCDPEELAGLAHFLEHMLFFSSEKYPLEDDYSKFLNEHGGHSNAFTSSEDTNFHFDVNAEHLSQALDRFAQFFICPLMSQDATSREINAVNSEHNKNLTTDRWRFDQVARHVSSKDHPYHKFGTGSLETLDVSPKSKGIDTREELIKFHKFHYSANLMCLCVYGRETLDELEKIVSETFQDIKNTGKMAPSFPGLPFLPEHKQIIIKGVPIKQRHNLELTWLILPELKNYKAGPCRYISHVLGHEADGSLFALLKSLGWASSLSAGENERSSDYSLFSIYIELTDAGQEHMEDIVGFTFQYISLLGRKGVTEALFDEIRTVCEMKFHYQDKYQPMHYVTRLAGSMQLYPVEDWLAGSSLPRTFDPDAIKQEIEFLTPENVRIIWSSKQFEGMTNETEPWYGTSYTAKRVSESLLESWKNAPLDPRLHLPDPNPFIPTDFSLKEANLKMQYPYVLRNSSLSKLWYKPDTKFQTPKACVMIHLHCPECKYSPESSVLSTIFTKLLLDYLNEYAYFAEIAGLQYSIQRTSHGFLLFITGYNHKLYSLLERIVDKAVNFQVKEDRFLVIKEKLMKDYVNYKFQQPYQQAMYYCSLMMEQNRWHIKDYLETLPSLNASDLQAFFPKLFSRIYADCYAAGNMTTKEAEALAELIENRFTSSPSTKTKPLLSSQATEDRITKLDNSEMFYPISGLNPDNENSALHVYLQVGQDETVMNILVELFVLSAKQPAFHQLRSVEQLGYITALVTRNDCGVQGVQFIVQSTVKDPNGVEERVEDFLKSFETTLTNMSDEEFQRNVEALVEIKLEKHKNIYEETNFFWMEIDNGACKFDRQQVEVAALRTLTKDELLEFYINHIKSGAPMRRKLSVQIYGKLHMQELELLEDGKNRIKDLFSFKRSQGLYSSLR
ncbi:hypothetical protein SELMODRAFT_447027 [Selaginella moellendorffii]|uniref:Insulin-degrading enzyme-like 1, peroxisomal n=1 Tax=Selaginella moellendorffii TaxID=88036 RepID=D8SW40_SELML|nr:insulin-degrading enzyme-like 1, peroxisomal [Selaginella moellendorffii]EFJ11426.1 hypothetical protein SELMODRAFT_447027 [Selaginella moellendorffii]|eukprot:XP_002987590.1 insulin-degrading enzyme-like 1, peroxisomal [Selaginella moellendorffii]